MSAQRAQVWSAISSTPWDVVVIGGGITGAGIAREAVRRGLRTLLLEQTDYSWGTSSRSSKMVHGGLRYIAQGEIRLTWHSLTERERLLSEAPGLVDRMRYHFAHFKGVFPGRWPFKVLLMAYDLLARIRDHRYLSKRDFLHRIPGYRQDGLQGASQYTDAVTDDSRLVQRILDEAVADGLVMLNYVKVTDLIMAGDRVAGLRVQDQVSGDVAQVAAKVSMNATGAWADRLRQHLVNEHRVRPLRGSHLLFMPSRLSVTEAIICHHPVDGRVMFIYPWEGRTVVGTTDLDHRQDLDIEAVLDESEMRYMLEGVNAQFPEARLKVSDIVSTWSGVRPVVSAGSGNDPSKESRGHSVWDNQGLITVTGGKLTTFRLIALDALKLAQPYLGCVIKDDGQPVFSVISWPLKPEAMSDRLFRRLGARLGLHLPKFLAEMPVTEWQTIADTETALAEIRWACRYEQVVHLDDLLLRRVRLGLLLPHGGVDAITGLDSILNEELGWSAEQIAQERVRYSDIWRRYYYLPITE
ncbi:MAG: glycerol-3-phosphate dehydrogenase/oxidase [Moraxellaceae bacterium]|nr:glycerol-3-phosphate dehydrogenase/oxidase [Moraxellaceae bacterium]